MKYLFLVISFLEISHCHAQSLYVSTDKNDIYGFDLSGNCSAALFPGYTSTGARIQDIAINSFGKLYICRNDSIFLLDDVNATTVFVTSFANRNIKSIEIGPEGRLYAVEKKLLRYDFFTGMLEELGPLPQGLADGGCLVFYQTQLFMSTATGGIYRINIGDPASSGLYYDPKINGLEGLVVAPARCPDATSDVLRMFAFEKLSDNQSLVHIIDMEKKITYRNYCAAGLTITGNTGFQHKSIVIAQIGSLSADVTPASCPQSSDGRIDFNMNAIPANISGFTYSINNSTIENTTGVFTNLKSGSYPVHIQTIMGCFKDTVITVPVKNNDCNESIFVPGAFTPNADGKNDVFRVRASILFPDFQMQIFNRDGQKVFQANSILEGWDGTIGGVKPSASVYIWLIRYRNLKGELVYRKGQVLLLR
jgi:gliding motility-associated-like protein